jgi:hypothetical protein
VFRGLVEALASKCTVAGALEIRVGDVVKEATGTGMCLARRRT